MKKYYTRVCNFYYGNNSKKLIKQKKTISLKGRQDISFDHIEILSRNSIKKIHIRDIKKENKMIREKIIKDLKVIKKTNKNFSNFNFNQSPNIMGILNITPDSFSDGGKFNKKKKSYKKLIDLFNDGANIIDIGGESTRPGSKNIKTKIEWSRVKKIIKKFGKKFPLSLDSRKSIVIEKSIKLGVKLINDISGFTYDEKTIDLLKKYKTPLVIHHIKGTPENMQKNPNYNNVLLDIYDYFEKKIEYLRLNKINHNNIVLDPGIGFGKNLKHNMRLISNISIFHSLGFPILLGISRKKFIKDLSGKNDSKNRIGGTVSASLISMMQGVQILRIHDVNEIKQAIKIFKKLI